MYLEKGSTVKIYHDPLSQNDLEGIAEIEEIVKIDFEFIWIRVKFLDDGDASPIVLRKILNERYIFVDLSR